MRIRTLLAAFTALAIATPAFAEGELNLYSSRHYDTDERLYSDFEAQTGITINRIEAKAGALMARMQAEGRNSPADVLLTVDAGNLHRAGEMGLLQPVESDVLDARIPDNLRDPDGNWYAFSRRARMIFYAKDRVDEPPATYEALADPRYEGQVCARSSSNIYMQSLLASVIAHAGTEAATDWAEGLSANFARRPQGGDTDQLRAIISGECDIVLANSYYFARALRKPVKGLSDEIGQIGYVFPNQDGRGAHVNVSGGGVAADAPNRANAIRFLEYLASPSAQEYFAAGNDEFPVVGDAQAASSVASLGAFEADALGVAEFGANRKEAQMIYDRVGYE
jgi:iron(III) transport system substrate-binding protein